ncbi:hypothetical protein DAPPUDRAFT_300224 [Daphnia pulex]|uniref:MARVEL domain-containing protein n=1 Tax=Daphnia pulex TaxID=6669 RepID=E9G5G0_DAPPU|nr:hypothetical protein DAPPUDRAFT_300224 [Daphnia pulex]|eukprot:EFX85635.1 hypothetical protein DAPPUDRAFT_300224 [Daphnia pulex]
MSVIVNQCGFSLQTGTKILGWLYLIGGFLLMLKIAMMMPDHPETNILIGVMVGSVVWNAVNILLLFSAHKNSRPSLMLPWLICKAVIVLVGIGLEVFWSISLIMEDQLDNANQRVIGFGKEIEILFFFAFGSALGIYFWLVVYSYYQQLKEELSSSTKDKFQFSKFNSSNDV